MRDWKHFPPGSAHPNAKFNDEERDRIRQRLASGVGVREMAREKGCDPSTISRMKREKERE